MKTGDIIHGFKLKQQSVVDEINATVNIFEHEKSGARLFNLQNDDDNKLFSITFKTPPDDDTGLPHILEHSVLCGSRKFPVKDPFIEINKGSLNSFVNAFTYPDKTMYPCASRNEQDFYNLMDIYLDAVLFPNIYNTPETLMQEGWHYELNEKDGEITYKGVVYNEMKGAFSSAEQMLMRKNGHYLYPDTPYKNESGGDPEVIPNLTSEQFLAFHKKHYHPSNSYIFLYGDGNLDKQLQLINDDFLSNFDKIDIDMTIPLQKPFDEPREVTETYPVTPGEDESEKTLFGFNFMTDLTTDPEHALALDILSYILVGTPASPLKKALLEAEIGKDVFGFSMNSIQQSSFNLIVKNSEADRSEKFKQVVLDTLQGLVNNGIDKKLVEAAITITEFKLREADTKSSPKGLFYNGLVLRNWLHDADPTAQLRYEEPLSKIKTALTTDYFEQMIETYLLNNNHRSMVILKPESGLVEKKGEELRAKLADYKASLSNDEINQLVEQTNELRIQQQTPNSPENLAKLPLLSLDEIDRKAEELPLVEKEIDATKVLSHPIFTNGIGYLNLYFDTTVVPQDKIPYIALLTEVLGMIGTENYDYSQLSNEELIQTGGIGFGASAVSEKDNHELYYPKLQVKSKVLIDKLPKLIELLDEITNRTNFDDPVRLREIIREAKSGLEMNISFSGTMYAVFRATAYFSPSAKYRELIDGISFYKFLADIDKNFETKSAEVIANLKNLCKLIFNRNNLLVSFTSSEDDYQHLEQHLGSYLSTLSSDKPKHFDYNFDLTIDNEAFMTPGQVQYAAKAYNFRKAGYDYSGKMAVMSKIVHLDYLFNRIRIQGGAYGAMINFSRNGNMFMGSYRDPNLSETYKVYDQTVDYLNAFKDGEREMQKYIIGTIGDLDHPMTPSMKGETAASHYIANLTQEEIQQQRDDVLSVTAEDIRNFAKMIQDLMSTNCYSVIGSAGKIEQDKELFKKQINLFE